VHPLTHGIYSARLATSPADIAAALNLRQLVFRTNRGILVPSDADPFDETCAHVLVTIANTDETVACFRVLRFASGQGVHRSYSAQFYNLTPLQAHPAPLIELGRFCLHPDHSDPDILRLAWAALARLVDSDQATMLFGCSSFEGADPALHRQSLAWLARHHLGPANAQPACITPEHFDLRALGLGAPNTQPPLPPLLRTYLAMGGRVSDHAVIDHDLNTLHVFTALNIATIPPARARALRALAALSDVPS
jgi:putative hemolysin